MDCAYGSTSSMRCEFFFFLFRPFSISPCCAATAAFQKTLQCEEVPIFRYFLLYSPPLGAKSHTLLSLVSRSHTFFSTFALLRTFTLVPLFLSSRWRWDKTFDGVVSDRYPPRMCCVRLNVSAASHWGRRHNSHIHYVRACERTVCRWQARFVESSSLVLYFLLPNRPWQRRRRLSVYFVLLASCPVRIAALSSYLCAAP